MAKTGPGKYELSGTVGELLHRMSQDGPDEESGDVSESGRWYGLIRGPFKMGELKKSYPEEFSGLDKADRANLRSAAGAIVSEDDQGFVDVELYETVRALKAAWARVTEDTTMATDTFRACYWIDDTRQHEVVLTRPEHAELPDDELEAEALAEAKRADFDLDGGSLVIGNWRA